MIDFIGKSGYVPKQIIEITEEQKQVIELFANTTKDEHLNIIYKLNDCSFTIHPKFN